MYGTQGSEGRELGATWSNNAAQILHGVFDKVIRETCCQYTLLLTIYTHHRRESAIFVPLIVPSNFSKNSWSNLHRPNWSDCLLFPSSSSFLGRCLEVPCRFTVDGCFIQIISYSVISIILNRATHLFQPGLFAALVTVIGR